MIVVCAAMMALTALYRTKPSFMEEALSYLITPAQKVITSISGWVKDKINFYASLNEIELENALLREKIDTLELESARLRLVEQENQKLSELLQIDQKYPEYETVGAEIIAEDPSHWYANFIINKGSKNGLLNNMVIIAPGGLVGRIFETGANYSKIRTLIDDNSSVSARSVRTGDIGIVKGDMRLMSEGLCRMELIDIDAEIIIGDEIVTSNLGEIFPPGIVIGHITEINADAGGLTKTAVIKPSVDYKNLDKVLVINQLFDFGFIDYETEEAEEL